MTFTFPKFNNIIGNMGHDYCRYLHSIAYYLIQHKIMVSSLGIQAKEHFLCTYNGVGYLFCTGITQDSYSFSVNPMHRTPLIEDFIWLPSLCKCGGQARPCWCSRPRCGVMGEQPLLSRLIVRMSTQMMIILPSF